MNSQQHNEGVIVYSGPNCAYCVRAKRLLDNKQIRYKEILVNESPELRAEMERRSNRRTLPQIFINGFHVGGFDDMAELDRQGKLDPLLEDVR